MHQVYTHIVFMLTECTFISYFAIKGNNQHLVVDRSATYVISAIIANFNSFRTTLLYFPALVLIQSYFVFKNNFESEIEQGF
jgi:hypothetical protein